MRSLFLTFITVSLSLASYSQGLVPFHKDGNWGFMDTLGNEKIAPQFDQVSFFIKNRAAYIKNSQMGIVAADGKLITEAIYSDFVQNEDGTFSVVYQEDWMLIDSMGKVINDEYFEFPLNFKEGLAMINLREPMAFYNKCGFVNIYSDTVIPLQYELASNFSEGLCMVSFDQEKYGYIDRTGKLVIPAEFEIGALMEVNGSYELSEFDFSDGFAAVSKDGLFGVINKKGELVIDYQFNSVGKFVNGLAPASKDGLWGYIDTKGKWKIEPQFSSAERFSNGIAVVCVGESSWECLYTFINSKGKQLFKPFILGTLDFTAPMLFQEGFFACIIAPKTYGYVNRKGDIIWSTEF